MTRTLETIDAILASVNPKSWSAMKDMQNGKYIYTVLDRDEKRVAVCSDKNNALVCAAAPDILDQWAYLHSYFIEFGDLMFSRQNNSLIKNSNNPDIQRLWSKLFIMYKDFLRVYSSTLTMSVDQILISREARCDPYENKKVSAR